MTNLERIKMETEGINYTDAKLEVYLLENDLSATGEYTKANNLNLLKTALAILESVANNPQGMKDYKTKDNLDVSKFAENLQSRIEQLNKKIREIEYKLENVGASFVYMFSK